MQSGIGSGKVREEAPDFTDGKLIRKSGKESGQAAERTEYWILNFPPWRAWRALREMVSPLFIREILLARLSLGEGGRNP